MLLDFLFPNRCANCMAIIDGRAIICQSCYPQIDFTHFQLDDGNILYQKSKLSFPLEYAASLMYFDKEGLSQKILHQLKYGQRESIGEALAKWTVDKINYKKDFKFDLITTVPLHSKKQKKRGYNQLYKFGNYISASWNIPIDHNLLKRNTSGKSQASKRKSERQTSGSQFSLVKEIQQQHILILDDVFTTGNTMNSVAWELLKSGNNKVSILVMAMD